MADVPVYLITGYYSGSSAFTNSPGAGRVLTPAVTQTRFAPSKSLTAGVLGRAENPLGYFTNPLASVTVGESAGTLANAYERAIGSGPGRIAAEPVTPGLRQNAFLWNHIGPTVRVKSVALGGTITFTTNSVHNKSGTFEAKFMGFGSDSAFGAHNYGIAGLDGVTATATVTGVDTFTIADPGATGSSILGTATIIDDGVETAANITAASISGTTLTLTTTAHAVTPAPAHVLIAHLRGLAELIPNDSIAGEVRACTVASSTSITMTVDATAAGHLADGVVGYVGVGPSDNELGDWDIYNPEMNSDTHGTDGRYCPDFPVSGFGYDAELIARLSDMEFERADYLTAPLFVMKTFAPLPLRGATTGGGGDRFLKRYTGEGWDEFLDPMIVRALGRLITAGHTPVIRGIVCSLGLYEMTNIDPAAVPFPVHSITGISGDVITLSADHGLSMPTVTATLATQVKGTANADGLWDIIALPATNTIQVSNTFAAGNTTGQLTAASSPHYLADDMVEFVGDLRTLMVDTAGASQEEDTIPVVYLKGALGTGVASALNQALVRSKLEAAGGKTDNASVVDQGDYEPLVTILGTALDSVTTFDAYTQMGSDIADAMRDRLDALVPPVNRGMPVYFMIADSYGEGLATLSWALTNDGDYNGSEVVGRQAKIYNWNSDDFEDYSTQINAGTFPDQANSTLAGFEGSLILELTKRHDGSDIFLVKMVRSGSRLATEDSTYDIRAWAGSGLLNSWLETAFARLVSWGCRNNLVPDVRGAFVHLGTNDGVDEVEAAAFVTELPGFVDELREKLSTRTDTNDMPVIWGLPIVHPGNAAVHEYHDTVRTALTDLANADPQFVAVNLDSANFNSRDLTGIPIAPDKVHISLAGQIRMGIELNQGFDLIGQTYGNVMVEPNPLGILDTV